MKKSSTVLKGLKLAGGPIYPT